MPDDTSSSLARTPPTVGSLCSACSPNIDEWRGNEAVSHWTTKAVADRMKVIPVRFYPIATHLKAIHGHFYPIADHLNPNEDHFYPMADRLKVIADGKKVIWVGFK